MNICFFFCEKSMCHAILFFIIQGLILTVFDLKFASMNYLLTIFELVHTCILLKTYFRHKLRNSDWNTDENFLLENDNKAISRTVCNGSQHAVKKLLCASKTIHFCTKIYN